ncbi:MAG: FliM/FliN family flagellar motor switch protein, partial [Pseudomonadales bacterium]
ESLADIVSIEPFQEYSNSSPELASLPIENEDFAQFTFNIGFGGTSGACHLVLPFSLVKEIKAHIESEGNSASQVVDTNWRNAIEGTLQQTAVELKAVALEKKIPLGDLVGIKVGDLFPIGPLGDVTLKVGQVELAVGVAGTAEGQNAVQITQTRLA